MYSIGTQLPVRGSCPSQGCATASGAYSGVYNSHASPHQGRMIEQMRRSGSVRPGSTMALLQPHALPPAPAVGVQPIGNYMISQSLPTKNTLGAVALGNNTFEFGGDVFSPANQFMANGRGMLLGSDGNPLKICNFIRQVGRRNMFEDCHYI